MVWRSFQFKLLSLLCLTFITFAESRELNKTLISPWISQSLSVDTAVPDYLPAYEVSRKHQIWIRNGWKGKEDFSAKVRFAWEKRSLFIVFDIRDDASFPSRSEDLSNLSGDYILLHIMPGTAAPNVIKEQFKILIVPNPKEKTCNVKLFPGETPITLIGTPEATLTPNKMGGYQVIMKLSTAMWNARPAHSRDLGIQMIFGDSDISGKVEHVLALFPKWGKFGSFSQSLGNIHFMTDTWIQAYPKFARFDKGMLDLTVNWGNLTKEPQSLNIDFVDSEGTVTQAYDNLKVLAAGTSAAGETLSLKLPELGKGREYTVKARISRMVSPISFKLISDPDLDNSAFSPDWIERRLRLKRRTLPAVKQSSLINETLQHIAGGGQVIWRAGAYDGSSREFPEVMRKNGKYSVLAKDGTADNATIPWALFGGYDTLDGMNEPLEINIPQGVGADADPIKPEYPASYIHLQLDKKRKRLAESANRLFLIGLLCTHSDGDQYPIIQVKNQHNRLLLEQRLRPGTSQFPKQPHCYILRVWLSPKDTSVRISNTNAIGIRAEIDFMALMGGSGSKLEMPNDAPRISFGGSPEAVHFNKMLVTNMFFARNLLMSPEGKAHASLPGGTYFLFRLRDHMMLLEELSAWYSDKQVQRAISALPIAASWQHKSFKEKDPVSGPLAVIAAWNHWRKSGLDNQILGTLWQSVILGELQKISTLTLSNAMGLFSGNGEFGTPTGDQGVSLPLQHLALTALACGIEMANAIDKKDRAAEWTLLSNKIKDNIQHHLVASPGGENVRSSLIYKPAHGLGEQQGIKATFPQGTLIYGKTANSEIILYNDDIRVFDSPYLYAGLPYLLTSNGYSLKPYDRGLIQKSNQFLRSGQVLRQKDFLERNLITYKSTATQMWMITAFLLTENINYASKMIESLVRYNFDEYTTFQPGDDAEISPFTLEGKLNVAANGDNAGGTGDDADAMSVSLLLKLSRLLAGIDDHDLNTLTITPRLPTGWQDIKAENWKVSHNIDRSVQECMISMTYRRLGTSYRMSMRARGALQNVNVRLGPFLPNERRVKVTLNGKTTTQNTVAIGGTRWVIIKEKKVRSMEIEATPTRY